MTQSKYYVVITLEKFIGMESRLDIIEMDYIEFMEILFPDMSFQQKEPETFFKNHVLNNLSNLFNKLSKNDPTFLPVFREFQSITLVKAEVCETGVFTTEDVCVLRPKIIHKFTVHLANKFNYKANVDMEGSHD